MENGEWKVENGEWKAENEKKLGIEFGEIANSDYVILQCFGNGF
jgi:hypothetical protein